MKQKKSIKFRPYLFSVIVFILGGFFVDSVYIEPNKLEVVNVDIAREDIAPEFNGKVIAFLSDIHYGVGNPEMLDRSVEKINEMNADIVILGGDFIDRDPKLVGECFSKLKNIKAKIGIYAVLGNHDFDRKIYPKLIEELKGSKIELLYNENVAIRGGNSSIIISGIPFYKKDLKLDQALVNIKKSDFVLLASHTPDVVEQQNLENVDAVLSGHLHGGQINIFGLERFWTPSNYGLKYKSGIIFKDDIEAIVTKGLGGSTFPMRLGAKPDIIKLVLSSK